MKQLREKSNYKSKESKHKKGKIKNMSSEEKVKIDQKKRDNMKQVRENSDYKSKECTHKKAKIKNMSAEEKEKNDQIKRDNMKQVRENNDYKSKESTHKKAKIKNMSAEEKEKIDQKQRDYIKQVRENNDYKSKESTHKKAKIKNMSAEEKEKIDQKQRDYIKQVRQSSTKETKDVLIHNDRKRKSKGKHSDDISVAINDFQDAIKDGLNYSCVCCCRYMFRTGVILFNTNRYKNATLTSINKNSSSENEKNTVDRLYICNNFDTSLRKNQMPILCTANGLDLEVIPEELCNLSSLELQLIRDRKDEERIIVKL